MQKKPKNLMQIFSRYLPDAENRRFLESALLVGNMRVDKNSRMLEVDFSYASLISKAKLYKIEAEIEKAYVLRSVRLLPKYPSELFSEKYFPEIMFEAYRTNIISKSFLQEYKAEFNGNRIAIEIPFGIGGIHFIEYNHIGNKISDIIFREFGLKYEIEFSQTEGYVSHREEWMQSELRKMRTRSAAASANTASQNQSASGENAQAALVPTEKRPSIYPSAAIVSTDDSGYLHIGNSVFDIEGALPLIGDAFEIAPSPIFYMTRPQSSVIALGEILGKEIAERKTKGKYKVEFCVTDYEATIMARFGVTDEELVKYQELSDGMFVAVKGSLHFDEADGELEIGRAHV